MISRSVLFERFAGRENELRHLADVRRMTISRGCGARVAIVAEAGIGKSRLLTEFERAACNEPGSFVRVRCEEFPVALAPIAGLLSVLRGQRELLRSPAIAAASALLKEGERFEDGGARKHALFGAIVAAVREAANRLTSLTIVVEDVHWSDLSTLEALRAVARRIDDVPVLVVTSYRPDDLANDPSRAVAVGDLEREGFDRICLGPLAGADIIALAREATLGLEDAAIQRIAELSEGRPYVAEELTRSVAEAGPAFDVQIALSLRGAVLERVSRLSLEELTVIKRAAVLGRNFSPGDLRALGSPAEHVTPALRSATLLQLLEEREVNGVPWFRFRHALTREILYRDIGLFERRSLHLAVADHVEAAGGRAAELAYHLSKAGDRERALAASEQAGDQAAEVAAYSDAVSVYARALELAKEPADFARLGRKFVRAFEHVGRQDPGANEILMRAIVQLGSAGWRDDALAIALVALRRSITIPGHPDRARLIGFAETFEGPHTPPDLRFDFEMMMAPVYWLRGDGREALAACDRAEGYVPEPTPAQQKLLMLRRVAANVICGIDLEYARNTLATYAATWPEDTSDDPLFSLVTAALRAEEGRTREARDAFVRAAAAFERRGNEQRMYSNRCAAALHGAFLGDFGLLDEIDFYQRRHGMVDDFLLVMARAIRTRAIGGDVHALLALFEREVSNSETPELLSVLGAHLAWMLDAGAARSIVTRTLNALPKGGIFGAFADAAVALGSDEDAALAMQRFYEERGVSPGAPAILAERALVAARSAARAGRSTESMEFAREALGPALETGIWYLIVPAYELANDAATARAELVRIGARAELERFDRRHGAPSAAPTNAPALDAVLTKRERQIAAAIARGISSSEAAKGLDISARTVDTHLNNVYRKLGIRSRAELIERFGDGDLARTSA